MGARWRESLPIRWLSLLMGWRVSLPIRRVSHLMGEACRAGGVCSLEEEAADDIGIDHRDLVEEEVAAGGLRPELPAVLAVWIRLVLLLSLEKAIALKCVEVFADRCPV
jgi:hypothetical protein